MEAGLSGQTCLAACVLGAAATGNFVEKLSGLGGKKQAAILSEAQGCWFSGARVVMEAGGGVNYRVSVDGTSLVCLQSSPMLAKAVSLKCGREDSS